MAGNIFINYRRGDDPGFAQALYSRLEQAFPPDRLFMDVDNIAPGLDFVQVLSDQVARCDVLIALIGKSWLGAADETGARRLDNPEDFVRIEIESALSQKKRVIPVLVNDAKMPRAAELPESLKPFARCNAVRLSHERFRADMQGLIKALEEVLAEAEAARRAAEAEAKRLRAAQAQRLRQIDAEGKTGGGREERPREGLHAEAKGLLPWIAGLHSEIAWAIPAGLVAITLLGWLFPGLVFVPVEQGGFGWGLLSLAYGAGGLIALGVLWRVRQPAMGGAELALYWLGLLCFLALVLLSLVRIVVGPLNLTPALAALGIAIGVALIVLRRQAMGGLEFAVYWFGFSLFFYALGIGLLTSTFFRTTELGAFFEVAPLRAPAILISTAMVSALAILAWRNRRLSKPEAAVYLLGIAYWLYGLLRLG